MKKIWFEETVTEEALKYKTRTEFRKYSSGAFEVAEKLGIIDKICQHMIWIRRPWNNEELAIEALKYETRNEFRKGSRGAYGAARNRRILDKICQHMPLDLKLGGTPYNKKWYEETIKIEALKYSYRAEFKKRNEGAYDAAKTLKILDLVCAHMKIGKNSSSYEKELFNKIKKLYPSTTKIRDREANVPNKPHIHGFDIDIYIPELKKGIEFDGEYWHSFEVMKKYKSGWPKEDVQNYHQIKDNYFKSKGISLFHLTDKEWLEDPRQSLVKILEFLRS